MRDKKRRQAVALEHIGALFKEASLAASRGEQELADRYVGLARRIAMKFKLRMPAQFKRRFCPSCQSYWRPGINVRVRLKGRKVVWSCLVCGRYTRLPYLAELKAKRKLHKN